MATQSLAVEQLWSNSAAVISVDVLPLLLDDVEVEVDEPVCPDDEDEDDDDELSPLDSPGSGPGPPVQARRIAETAQKAIRRMAPQE